MHLYILPYSSQISELGSGACNLLILGLEWLHFISEIFLSRNY
jgi:hypothetical protein